MVDIPGMTGELDLNPFDDQETEAQSRRKILLSEGRKWDGKGAPPSREAAAGYLLLHGGVGLERAIEIVGQSGTLSSVGDKVRQAVTRRESEHGTWLEEWRKNHPEATEDEASSAQMEAAADALGVEPDDLTALLEGGPGAAADERGAPLWPFEGSAESLADLTVENKSWHSKMSERGRRFGGGSDRTGARYFEKDTVGPLRWSPEQRADLQRVLHGMGLYGDEKIKLGSWGASDQAVYAELLAASNVEGLTWYEMLQQWKRNPPQDLIDKVKSGSERAPLVVRHTNPMDIHMAGRETSRSLTGEVDRGFVEGLVGAYQGVETAAQTGAYNVAESGGTVTDAPSLTAFADDKLRRENPIEVDGYQFLNQFQSFMSMLGAS